MRSTQSCYYDLVISLLCTRNTHGFLSILWQHRNREVRARLCSFKWSLLQPLLFDLFLMPSTMDWWWKISTPWCSGLSQHVVLQSLWSCRWNWASDEKLAIGAKGEKVNYTKTWDHVQLPPSHHQQKGEQRKICKILIGYNIPKVVHYAFWIDFFF